MRVLAHPLHPMLVHFPIAFWTSATVCDGATLAGVAQAGSYASLFLILGIVLALPAIVAGFVDFVKIPDTAMREGTRHMMAMGSAWVVYGAALVLRLDGPAVLSNPHPLSFVLSAVGFALMAVGGWYGGQLVYHHGAGHHGAGHHGTGHHAAKPLTPTIAVKEPPKP